MDMRPTDITASRPPCSIARRRGLEYGYGPEVFEVVRPLTQKIGMDKMLLDVEAACAAAASAGKVGVVGYCLGGSLAWLAATRLQGVAAASCYYGGRIAASADEKPRCPVQMHFGEKDQSIPLADVEKIKAAVPPSVEIFVYPRRATPSTATSGRAMSRYLPS